MERANAAPEMRKEREESSSQRPRRVRRSVKVEGSIDIEGTQRRRRSLALAPEGDRRDLLEREEAHTVEGDLLLVRL